MVHGVVRAPDAAADAGLAGDRTRRIDAHSRADRQRQNADRVPVVSRSADVPARARREAAMPRRLRLAAQGARRRRRTQPAGAARRHRARRRRTRRRLRHAERRHPHWRHAGCRARAISARAGRHPDHDPRVVVPAADVQCPRSAARRRDDHHRRDPCARADQARRAPGAVDRTARGALRAAAAAHRPLGDTASARGGREVSGGNGTVGGRSTALQRPGNRRAMRTSIDTEFSAARHAAATVR